MPRKTKRIFTRHNSTKFVLFTEGRDENGEKISENVLIPVKRNYVAGSSLFLGGLSGAYGVSPETDLKRQPCDSSKIIHKKYSKIYDKDEEADLDKILGQITNLDENEDSDDENCNIRAKVGEINFFQEQNSFLKPHSNVQIEIFEEGDDDFSDDFGQFSDAESDEEFDNFGNKSTLTSFKSDCPESIKLLNESFKRVLSEYTENQIGALDDEEISGNFTTENEQMRNFINTPLHKKIEDIVIGDVDEELKEKVLLYAEDDKPPKIVEIMTEKPIDFDCESVTSTYSNKYNHPAVIREESKIRKIKIPNNPLKKSLTKSQLKQLDSVSEDQEEDEDEEEDKFSVATSCTIRVKGETPEQRRERKNLFKEAKRESRKLKKENKLAFKNEKKLQISQALNIQNTKGIRLM
ncbi:protein LTV1 [Nephila pilipes]|uniref:Protein LTV1 homolog n=1 Tax=Nephila pilipes TaxID=299642 RepID=A0A8X6NIG6_NEPPI|nr:protein LTV1 [Nephila pilipes]